MLCRLEVQVFGFDQDAVIVPEDGFDHQDRLAPGHLAAALSAAGIMRLRTDACKCFSGGESSQGLDQAAVIDKVQPVTLPARSLASRSTRSATSSWRVKRPVAKPP
jgi:hypothetical protein